MIYYLHNAPSGSSNDISRQTKEARHDYYERNRSKLIAYQKTRYTRSNLLRRARHERDPRKIMLYMARSRAKKFNLDFDLTVEDIVIPEFCPICEIRIKVSTGKQSRFSPTLDRVDNTKGYTKDNVRVISQRANTKKADLSIREAERLLDYMRGTLAC